MNLNPEGWLKDKRGNWSFTRIAPAICLFVAIGMWAVGIWKHDFQSYCQQGVDKLLDFAKWAFGAGKVSEELGVTFGRKDNVQSYSSKVETTTSNPAGGTNDTSG